MAGCASPERTILSWVFMQIPEIENAPLEGFQDGVLLHKLVSAVGDNNITGCVDKPENKKQKEKNVDAALKFLKIVGVDISGIKSRDILSGSDKILPLLERIFFSTLTKLLRPKGVSRAKGPTDPREEFKTWINDKLYPDIRVHNFTSDWCSGRTLGALLDSISPGLCEDWRSFIAAQSVTNLQNVMEKAKKHLNVTQLITPTDLQTPDIDPLCVIIYLSQLLGVKVNSISEQRQIPRALHHSQSVPDGVFRISHFPQAAQFSWQMGDTQPFGAQRPNSQRVTPGFQGDYTSDTQLLQDQYSRPSMYPSIYQTGEYYHDYSTQQSLPSSHANSYQSLGASSPWGRTCNEYSHPGYYKQKQHAISDPSDEKRMGVEKTEDDSCYSYYPVGDDDLEQVRFREPAYPEEFWNLMERMHVPYNRELRKFVKTGGLVLSKEPLGTGHYGTVYKGRFADPDKGYQIVAAKSLSVEGATLKTVKDFLNEVDMMRSFQHVNVLNVLAFTFRGGLPYILLPLHEYKDLHTFLHETDRNTSRKYLHQFAEDIARGMEYITSQGFVHRDLAARNCLVNDEWCIQVADFGFTRDVFASDYVITAKQPELSLRWMAPELFQGQEIYKTTTDVWAYGIVLWEIYSFGDTPYSNVTNDEDIGVYLQNGKRLEKPVAASEQIYDLMLCCWNEDYKKRPNFKEIVDSVKAMEHVPPQEQVVAITDAVSTVSLAQQTDVKVVHSRIIGQGNF